jgi:hypothetical protein
MLKERCPVELFRTLNILPVPCGYIMENVYYIELNNRGLKKIWS